jgi:hypothetical protein
MCGSIMEPGAEPMPRAAAAVEADGALSLPTIEHYNHLLEGLQRVAARVAEHDAKISQLSSMTPLGERIRVVEGAVITLDKQFSTFEARLAAMGSQKQVVPAAPVASVDIIGALKQQNQALLDLDQRMASLTNHVASLSSIEELLTNAKKEEHPSSRVSARTIESRDTFNPVFATSRHVQEAASSVPPQIRTGRNGEGVSQSAEVRQIGQTVAALSHRLQELESHNERGIPAHLPSSLTAERHDHNVTLHQGSTADRLQEVVSLIRRGPAHAG